MYIEDFSIHEITVCTSDDITNTGAVLKDVELQTILVLQKFFELSHRSIILLPNGITSGKHSSILHPRGRAVDVAFSEKDGTVNIYRMWKKAIQAGFTGIGIYHNDAAYSMHLDRRKDVAFWAGYKKHRSESWNYVGVFKDPKDYLK